MLEPVFKPVIVLFVISERNEESLIIIQWEPFGRCGDLRVTLGAVLKTDLKIIF